MPQPWIDETAASWFVRTQEGLSLEDEKLLKEWLHADPKHQEAYASFVTLWADIDQLKPLYVATPRKKIFRPLWLTACVAAVVFMFISTVQWYMHKDHLEFSQNVDTPIGSIREYTLNDGTSLFLDTDTHASIEYYDHKRLVRLNQGQIALHVTKDPQRPLFVDVHNVQVRVTGTRFEVRCVANEEVRVSVEEGSVDISYTDNPYEGRIKLSSLHATDRVTITPQGIEKETIKLSNGSISPWKNGRLLFEHTPLKEVLSEFERYGAKSVTLSPKLASIPISGTFEVKQFAGFIEHLPKALPLNVLHQGGEIYLVEH